MVAVTYHCPRCGAVVELDRSPYLADKSVTPFPLEGWRYVRPDEEFEREDVDGVRFVCGQGDLAWSRPPNEESTDDPGCGEAFYLNFVRYEEGDEVEPPTEPEYVELAEGRAPTGPRGPEGPSGPNG